MAIAEVLAKQNGHKGSMLGLSLKIPKTYRNYPLKSLELFYAENCSKNTLKIRKMTRPWKAAELAILQGPSTVRQSGQIRKSQNVQKITQITLQLLYTKIGLKTHLIFKIEEW